MRLLTVFVPRSAPLLSPGRMAMGRLRNECSRVGAEGVEQQLSLGMNLQIQDFLTHGALQVHCLTHPLCCSILFGGGCPI